MDFRLFQKLWKSAEFDEIKIIGKDVEKEGRMYHIMALLRKEKKVMLSVLELCEPLEQKEHHFEEIRRNQMKQRIESETNSSFFMRIRSFQCGEAIYEVSGANSGNCQNGDFAEAYLLFIKLMQEGWSIPETSFFYEVPWEHLSLTQVELRDEMELLPEWGDEIEVSFDTRTEEGVLGLPVTLEVGKKKEINFTLKNGKNAVCYLHRVYLLDVWEEEQRKMEDPAYRKRMLLHMTEAEFEQMKEHIFEALLTICPKGMCFPVVEYECTENVGLQFFEKEYLDTIEKPKNGSTSVILMRTKPEEEIGSHGLKLRACAIQVPVEKTTESMEAELFSYIEIIQRRTEKIENLFNKNERSELL